jgi:diguanylate cyclase (GGDEF)-like protein
MARKFQNNGNSLTGSSGKTILLVDDNLEYLEATALVLEREGHVVLTAESGPAALGILRVTEVDLLLLDFFMPGMTGEEVLLELRKFNRHLQVILQTGYASECPPRELLQRLDIQGYFDKSEGPDKLLLWTDVGLKAAYSRQLLEKSRNGLEYILGVAPELYKIQPIENLLQGILLQVSGLLGTSNSFLAIMSPSDSGLSDLLNPSKSGEPLQMEGFLAMLEDDTNINIRAGVGKYRAGMAFDELLNPESKQMILKTLSRGELFVGSGLTLMPLLVGALTLGIIYLETEVINPMDAELLKVFSGQAAVAIQNSQLYEMATMDPLTGVFVRRFYNHWIQRTLKNASRTRKPVGLLMVDMDCMKRINDGAGHLVGDKALVELARTLKESTRTTDFVFRFGGDEFTVILSETTSDGIMLVVNRILEKLRERIIRHPGGEFPLQASIGVAILSPPVSSQDQRDSVFWNNLGQNLLREADAGLYEVKNDGRGKASALRTMVWPE